MLGIIIALIFLSGSATARHITHAMQRHCAVPGDQTLLQQPLVDLDCLRLLKLADHPLAHKTIGEATFDEIEMARMLHERAAAPESKHSPEQVLAKGRRRRSSEYRPPASPKGINTQRANARDLGLDRGRICQLLVHGYALG
jgi:hypothetical protein